MIKSKSFITPSSQTHINCIFLNSGLKNSFFIPPWGNLNSWVCWFFFLSKTYINPLGVPKLKNRPELSKIKSKAKKSRTYHQFLFELFFIANLEKVNFFVVDIIINSDEIAVWKCSQNTLLRTYCEVSNLFIFLVKKIQKPNNFIFFLMNVTCSILLSNLFSSKSKICKT